MEQEPHRARSVSKKAVITQNLTNVYTKRSEVGFFGMSRVMHLAVKSFLSNFQSVWRVGGVAASRLACVT